MTRDYLEGHIARLPDAPGCWIWIGTRNEYGYGVVNDGRLASGNHRKRAAHRKVYELLVGAIPNGLSILHRCDVPACVNPAHLYPGTQQQNLDDAVMRGRVPFGSRRPDCKISDAALVEVRAAVARGETRAAIAKRYGVSRTLIIRIARGRSRAPRSAITITPREGAR